MKPNAMLYGKLVRDKIPEIIRGRGATPVTHVADEAEYKEKLTAKLQEEVDEYVKEPNPEELADIMEVVYALCQLQGADEAKLEGIRRKKVDERGGFEQRIILDETQE